MIRFPVHFWQRTTLAIAAVLILVSFVGGCNPDLSQDEPESMPVFKVESSGLTDSLHNALGESIGIAPENIQLLAGAASFIDPREAMKVPKKEIPPQTFKDEERGEVTVETGIDMNAVEGLEAPNEDVVVNDFRSALRSAGLLPGEGFPGNFQVGTSNANLNVYTTDGSREVTAPLNTRVGISPTLGGKPYIGPGAVIAVSYTLQDVQPAPSRLTYAWRDLREGGEVDIIDRVAAMQRCRQRLESSSGENGEITLAEPKLVYYAPPLETQNTSLRGLERQSPVKTILPHYTCTGTLTLATGDEATLSQVLVPAVSTSEYRPEVDLRASADGGEISADVTIEGGSPPYTVEWSSTHVDFGPGTFEKNATDITYEVDSSRADIPETLSVHARDANGVSATSSRSLDVPITVVSPPEGGTVDFGSEGAGGTSWEKGVNDKFENVMRNQGVTERFVWDGNLAWEDDFHSPDDATWADNADVTLYSGHGWWGGFTFTNDCCSDGGINHGNDARGDWGDKDLEWLAILSCNVLDVDGNGNPNKHVVRRWTDEFDGIHAVLGFHTLAQLWDSTPKWFARGMTKPVSIGPYNNQINVRQAWFQAIEKTQAFREGVAIGPISNTGALTVSDYFWGRGSVGPDIPSNRIDKIWLVREWSYYHYDI
jgi:hypothetical protein